MWKRKLPDDWSSNVSLIRSKYHYNILNLFEDNELSAVSDIEDYGTRILFQKDSLQRNASIKFGFDWTRHAVSPNVISTAGVIAELLESSAKPGKHSK